MNRTRGVIFMHRVVFKRLRRLEDIAGYTKRQMFRVDAGYFRSLCTEGGCTRARTFATAANETHDAKYVRDFPEAWRTRKDD